MTVCDKTIQIIKMDFSNGFQFNRHILDAVQFI